MWGFAEAGAGVGHLPTAAGTGGAAAQQSALATSGTQERIVLVLQLQQFGPDLLIPAHVWEEVGGGVKGALSLVPCLGTGDVRGV